MTDSRPYLSVVVTTRNDHHGVNPLGRFQAFVNCLIAQCRRVELPIELIVVEWNPPADRPPLRDVLHWPVDPLCEIRIVQVPSHLHQTLKASDALPLFQMIAKNVGIRRARGEFVLSTNIDILLSNALVDAIARRDLQHGVMYRVDRHDVEADVPVAAPLDELMEYCLTHQIRKNTRWGSFPLDSNGRPALWNDDIVESGAGIQLGNGWHMREGMTGSRWRWVTERAEVFLEPSPEARLLSVEVDANPLSADATVDFCVRDESGSELLPVTSIANVFRGPTTVQLTIESSRDVRCLVFHGRTSAPGDALALYELRDHMVYRVRRIYWDSNTPRFQYLLEGWRVSPDGKARVALAERGMSVVTSPAPLLYAIEYGPITAATPGPLHFWITLRLASGTVAIQALHRDRKGFLPTTNRFFSKGDDVYECESLVDVEEGEQFWLVISNACEDDQRPSRFTILEFHGSVPQDRAMDVAALKETRAVQLKSKVKRWIGREPASPPSPPDDVADVESPKTSVVSATSSFEGFMAKFRPDCLHLNACGDFQLMSRRDWHELRGFAEFEMYSMNIDGLFGHTAYYAGVREHAFAEPACVYHIEHESGSGWTPEGENKLRKRIEVRGIGWLDSTTVTMLATFMKSVGRPMLFNSADWGFAQHQLPETVLSKDTGVR